MINWCIFYLKKLCKKNNPTFFRFFISLSTIIYLKLCPPLLNVWALLTSFWTVWSTEWEWGEEALGVVVLYKLCRFLTFYQTLTTSIDLRNYSTSYISSYIMWFVLLFCWSLSQKKSNTIFFWLMSMPDFPKQNFQLPIRSTDTSNSIR